MKQRHTPESAIAAGRLVTAGVMLLMGGLAGCRGEAPQPRAQGWADAEVSGQDVLPQYESQRHGLAVGRGLGEAMPAIVLEAQDMTAVFQLPSAALVQVRTGAGPEAPVIATAEAEQGQMVVLDRQDGVRVGRQVLHGGPLQRGGVYELFVLPPGGVKHEVTRTTVRPPTPQEIEAAREARLEREAEERRATREPPPDESPTTGPSP